jgi:hypothetical protein
MTKWQSSSWFRPSNPCGTLGLVGIMLFVAAKLVVHSAKYRIS